MQSNYLGLELKNPLVPSASPLSRSLDLARRLEDAGAAALVMYSLFEEELHHEQLRREQLAEQDIGHSEAQSFLPIHGELPSEMENYLQQLEQLKQALDIPVVASLNGISLDGWVEYGRALEAAGADALELNVYYIPTDPLESGDTVEQRYLELARELRQSVSLPIAMKLTPQFSNIGNLVTQLGQIGINGVALFNRLYQPDIDIDSLRVAGALHLSEPVETLMSLRWIAVLRDHVDFTLSATSGVHSAEDAVKLILAGADVVHLCSVLLKKGPEVLGQILEGVESWLEESPYETLEQARGVLSLHQSQSPQSFVRSSYISMLSDYPLPR